MAGEDFLECPVLLHGKVVTGFQRGSKELGFPTANLEFTGDGEELKRRLKHGVYFGLAKVENGPVYEMAMSVGDNPHYKNKEVTVEVHILHEFDSDFYGNLVTCLVAGYIRPMLPFTTLDALIDAIQSDCDYSRKHLAAEGPFYQYRTHPFLTEPKAENAGDLVCIM
eukprot:TRINITY_DN3075_c3_g1_i1.p1 TRINITY_DN3075_c3_g1~~TRINITY_DN3075_c3_g1_i1.p1  ORF type:complete len:167 (+),score=33.12 TRINITY_DN3075_c3_g1_i1:84-584(+)